MIKKYLLAVIIFLSVFTLKAQEITIISNETEFPMDGVTVLTKNGDLVGVTDFDGKFKIDSLNQNQEYFILNHYEIENDTMFIKNIKNNEYWVNTSKSTINLNEAVITNDKDFAILEGYFTAYVTNNGKFNIFTDGIMQIAINRKTQKVKKGKILEYRTFILDHEDEDENRKQISSVVFDDFIELPNLKLIRKFKRENNQSMIQTKEKGDLKNYELKDLEHQDFHMRLFGYDFSGFGEILNIEIKHSDLSKLNKIKHFSYFFTMDIKHKKEPEYSTLQNITNFYTLNVRYKNRNEIDEDYVKYDFKRSYYNPKSEYWNDEKTASLYDLFSKMFQENLVEQPNEWK